MTNAFHLKADIVAELDKKRRQIKQFFKWIKQNLKVKTFLGTSENAVLTQLCIALCAYLVLAYLSLRSKIGLTMQQMLQLLKLNLFERRDLNTLFEPPEITPNLQLAALYKLLDSSIL